MEKPVIILVHGFAGGPFETESIRIKLIEKGYQVINPMLAGHENRSSLKKVTYRDWIASIEDELEKIKDQKMILIGFSMGGLICIQLAIKYKVELLITLNTPVYYWNLKRIVKNICHDFRTGEFKSLKYYWSSSIKTPLKALLNFRILLNYTKKLFNQVNCNTLIIQGELDDTVNPKSAKFLYSQFSSSQKELIFYPNSDHQILQGTEQNSVAATILDRLTKI